MSAKAGKPAVHIESMASESVPLLATDPAQPEFNDGFRCEQMCTQARKPSYARRGNGHAGAQALTRTQDTHERQ